ncbi:M12 family metallo-peptidase [Chryseobacterium sp. Ch-15]|uniref:M12 family metallo-peptidase n=1 Tax=Chryseobacterium muglaense TaxID=2893752 RepID=A0A9Q3YWG3_9FLAO|nr:zinc-dependent metalloprotease family protein [Chryseobacterium muglaense]MBD3904591.1 T9SS type A sorting domain-containing protein [Chryseobacterium muglaense]MCC9035695.1 M12 family metallo-peptidase [Chryseobacterium muglaense]MCM2555123.1 M12 family metallo-peptidase [Chryseobacterium muglaense]
MKKLITVLFCSLLGGSAIAQWSPTTISRSKEIVPGSISQHFKLDLNLLKSQLKNAQETGPAAKPVYISLPNIKGKMERFAVYSFPVMVKELADQYELGSYVGVSVDNPTKFLRFSVSPNDFSSMVINNGTYEFIDAQNSDKTIYGVYNKSSKDGKAFVCSTSEGTAAISQMKELQQGGQVFTNQPTDFSKSSDKKYRTMRLALAVTGEYTAFHGGTVALALAAMNTTMTRVNGVFEKDLALHLNIQNFPNIVYTNAATDFYTPPSNPPLSTDTSINYQLQQLLSSSAVGSANYDIGHVFNAAGNNGNAGCIGCVCLSPTSTNPNLQASLGKGSAFTQSTSPVGPGFDIDFVAHEMGHQLGGNHTFAHALEPSGTNVEPGSGSTIMGYAGITGATTDVQLNSDPFFHKVSILQIQNNLDAKTCDTETSVNNNPPVIAALPTYNIPKGTAFVLTASATDPENDPLTYMWEQVDNASVVINKTNIGSTATGATFRSLVPTVSPTRYFPKLSSVLAGVLDNSNNEWESVSKVARTTKFSVTVRDNNPIATQQQTQFAEQTIVVGNEGPFKLNTIFANISVPTPIEWDVAGTNAAPYNVANVKIDYTTDNGTTWTVLNASTLNDGTENFTFASSMNGQTIKVRISSIGNVFYAIKSIAVTQFAPCNGTAPSLVVNNITTSSATVSWAPVTNATFVVRYKKVADANWTTLTTTSTTTTLANLLDGTAYEVQIATVCSGTQGNFSASSNFTTTGMTVYCAVNAGPVTDDYISNVSLANMTNASGASTYTSYVSNPALQVNLNAGGTYTLSITRAYLQSPGGPYPAATSVWIDYNRNGVFDESERILTSPIANGTPNPLTFAFTVPNNAVQGLGLRMRIGMLYVASAGVILTGPCGNYGNYPGEFEDYNVVITGSLSTNESGAVKNNGIQIYPNPATDFLNVTKVSDKATYKIYSAAGQLVGNGNISNGKINVSSLIKGAYVISIEDKGKESFNSKFIKK